MASKPSAPSGRPASSTIAASISAVWLGFVAWRAIRLIRAGNIKSDRFYDVKGKFDLPPEYAATASILAHQKRGRLGQKR